MFVGLLVLMLGLQFALLTAELSRTAGMLPVDGQLLLERTNGLALKITLVSALVFLPLTLLVGILSTFKIAGPIHRFQTSWKPCATVRSHRTSAFGIVTNSRTRRSVERSDASTARAGPE